MLSVQPGTFPDHNKAECDASILNSARVLQSDTHITKTKCISSFIKAVKWSPDDKIFQKVVFYINLQMQDLNLIL